MSRRGLLLGLTGAAALWSLSCHESAAETAVPSMNPLADAELKRAAQRGELCSAANATGTGLRGEYFAHDLSQGAPLLVRVDGTVDFDRDLEWPAQRSGQRPASARWTGWVKPPISGRYRFHADQAGARVTVARQPLVGEGAPDGASIEMSAGRFYPITLEVQHLATMTKRLRLEWTAPHGARFLVPRALLFIPNDTVAVTKP
jgi:PA14 domain